MAYITSTRNRRPALSYRSSRSRRNNATSTLVVIATLLAVFVFGTYQLTNPPSCGTAPVGNFMTVQPSGTSNTVSPCAPGEVAHQVSFVESLQANAKTLTSMLPAPTN